MRVQICVAASNYLLLLFQAADTISEHIAKRFFVKWKGKASFL